MSPKSYHLLVAIFWTSNHRIYNVLIVIPSDKCLVTPLLMTNQLFKVFGKANKVYFNNREYKFQVFSMFVCKYIYKWNINETNDYVYRRLIVRS